MYRRGKTIFRSQPIRCIWIKEKECWFYSPIDFVKILKGSSNPSRYWWDIKHDKKIIQDELYGSSVKFRLDSKDGKRRPSDVVTADLLEKIGLSLDLAGDRNFRGWIANLKTWSTVKDSWITHRRIE